MFSDSMWMETQSESSRTVSQLVWLTQTTSQWGCTRACGMLKTGPQEVGWWKRTGARLPSLLPSAISMQTLASGPLVLLRASRRPVTMRGCIKRWTLRAWGGWGGFRRTTWYTITVLMWRGSLRVSPLNALRGEENRGEFADMNVAPLICDKIVKYSFVFI